MWQRPQIFCPGNTKVAWFLKIFFALKEKAKSGNKQFSHFCEKWKRRLEFFWKWQGSQNKVKMDDMLQSPSSFNIPSIGTPHHPMEEEHMINPQALAKQEQKTSQNDSNRFFGGMTPQNLLGSGQTPHSLLASPAVHNKDGSDSFGSHVYAPVAAPASPAPPSPQPAQTPMTALAHPSASLEPGIVPQLQNIVSTVNLATPLDLKKIALHARNAEYNPKRFAAVIMRIRDPRTTALIFRYDDRPCFFIRIQFLRKFCSLQFWKNGLHWSEKRGR